MIQSVFSVTLTMHFECRFRVWCLLQYGVCVIYWHLCPILTSTQTWWLCLYHEWTINPWMVRSDKGRKAVVSLTSRSRTSWVVSRTKRDESSTYKNRIFSAMTRKTSDTYVLLYTSSFKPSIRRKKLGNWLSVVAKLLRRRTGR